MNQSEGQSKVYDEAGITSQKRERENTKKMHYFKWLATKKKSGYYHAILLLSFHLDLIPLEPSEINGKILS